MDEVYTWVMRFLRMLTNSLLAGALGAAYLTIILLQLNPHVPLVSLTTGRWFLTLSLLYGVQLAVFFYVLLVVREFFSINPLSPGWASVRVLAWLAAATAAIAALLMWLNVSGLAVALGESAARRMTAGAAAASVSAVVLLGIAVAHYSFGRSGSRVGATLFVIAAFGSIALPLAARGPAVPLAPQPVEAQRRHGVPARPGPRVMMLLLDGASLDYIWPRTAEGRLPNFARLLETGARMDLATIRPTGANPVWAAVATGMYPAKNGVRSAAAYFARGDARPLDLLPDRCFSHILVQLGFVRDEPNSSASWRARPIWSILSDSGISVGVVRWPLTYPAPPVRGFVLSDRFHDAPASVGDEDDRAASPSDVLPIARNAFAAGTYDAAEPGPVRTSGSALTPDASSTLRDRLYSRAMRDLRGRWNVRVAAVRYQGLDTIGHYYMRDAQTPAVGAGAADATRRNARTMDRYYSYIDGEIGAALESLAAGDLLLVVSGFGMQPQNRLKELAGRLLGGPDLTGTHERAPDGFLLAYGSAVEPGGHPRGSVVDVTPTLLYFLGLPVGRDMDGYARTDLFGRAFTSQRPIAFIPTHNR